MIAIDRLVKNYGTPENPVLVLKGIDFRILEGESIAIVGHSGSGKSTLLNILGCLDVPTDGSYFLDGENVAHLDDDALSQVRNEKIGFVFQSFNLISHLNLLENVEVPLYYSGASRKTRRECALAMIERVGMSHRVDHFPNQLSGGECQRVAIARALSTDPRILLADEPTGNLDSANGEQILELFRELHGAGKTIVMVTHDGEIAEQLDRRIQLHDGEIVDSVSGEGR